MGKREKVKTKIKSIFKLDDEVKDIGDKEANEFVIAQPNSEGKLEIIMKEEEILLQNRKLLDGDSASDSSSSVSEFDAESIVVPVMNICILVVGTTGDLNPFIGIGKRLVQDGHRVRIGSHAMYRSNVMEEGLEFYPLAGDPQELSRYMVKTGGQLIPTGYDAITKEMPRNMEIIQQILESTWPAVSAADPDHGGKGVCGRKFVANAIISNPVSYGHVHVAERLGCPLHIMFPQPWVPTKAFPHPLANLPYNGKVLFGNYLSYKAVDAFMWAGTEGMVNRFREHTLHLHKIRKGEGGRNILLDLKIPHSFMWSKYLVPKPADWSKIYDVVGTVGLHEANTISEYDPSDELKEFLKRDNVVFIGFGSMVINDPKLLTKKIIKAAETANANILLQSGWSDMAADLEIPDRMLIIGKAPHDWLFHHVSAVIHHGGAGTTAAGLLAGKPTFICPFFGDQPFWGRAVVDAQVGVEPCPVNHLTVAKLVDAFETLNSKQLQENAQKLRKLMLEENGAENAVKSFYRQLPIENMRCDLDPSQVATRWIVDDQLKISEEAELAIVSSPEHSDKAVIPYHAVDYSVRGPDTSLEGFSDGAGTFLHEVGTGIVGLVRKPAKGYRKHGIAGAAKGVVTGIGGLVVRPMYGMALWADKAATGFHNKHRDAGDTRRSSVFDMSEYGTQRDFLHVGPGDDGRDRSKKLFQPVVSVNVNDTSRKNMGKALENVMASRKYQSCKAENKCVKIEPAMVKNAFYKSDGTLKIEFDGRNDEARDHISENEIQCLKARCRYLTIVDQQLDSLRSKLKVPKLNICIMAIGLPEDIEPYFQIATQLQRDGHRVRIATHDSFRDRARSLGLNFYPLGKSSSKFNSYIDLMKCLDLAGTTEEAMQNTFSNLEVFEEIILSTWPAVCKPDPHGNGSDHRPFLADAIISNPYTFGHIHVAEKLGCPLHIMGPTPVVYPTRQFPHPLSNLPMNERWLHTNLLSYDVVECFTFQQLQPFITKFRVSLGLPELSCGKHLAAKCVVPFSLLCSPKFVEKPLDWDRQVDVVGNVYVAPISDPGYTPPEVVLTFLREGEMHIFMSLDAVILERNPRIVNMVSEAATLSNTRVLLQCENSNVQSSCDQLLVCNDVPVDWLLKNVNAYCHHGTPSATMQGLAFGLPGLLCPYYGEPYYWSQVSFELGYCATPIPAFRLSAEKLTAGFTELKSAKLKMAAEEISNAIKVENGIANAVASFYRQLPLEVMCCDLDSTKVANIYDPKLELKLSYEAQLYMSNLPSYQNHKYVRYKPYLYSTNGINYHFQDYPGRVGTFEGEISNAIRLIVSSVRKDITSDSLLAKSHTIDKTVNSLVIRPLNNRAKWSRNASELFTSNKLHSSKFKRQDSVAPLVIESSSKNVAKYNAFILSQYQSKAIN